MVDGGSAIPVLAFWDFAAAFPSVAHEWLFRTLRFIGAPLGLLNLIRGMYLCNCAFLACDGVVYLLFRVSAGILQGCPLSGMLFAVAIDPILRRFDVEVCQSGKGIIRACADDIGGALKSLKFLKVTKNICDDFRAISNLHLKPRKCVVIPTGAVLSAGLKKRITRWLEENIPEWSAFSVRDAAKYLGIMMGPKAGEVVWKAALGKWKDRSVAVAHSHAAASVSAHLYNT
eukprot:7587157-Heterocapsa_arctica.AAC.1